MDAKTLAPGQFPTWQVEVWQTAVGWARATPVTLRLWERVFTPAEKRRLGPNMNEAFDKHRGNVGMWCYLYGVSIPRAVVEINRRMNLLDADTADCLLRAFGEMPQDKVQARDWAIEKGCLVLNETDREAYWKQKPIIVDWRKNATSWVLLWELSRAALRKQVVDMQTFGKQKRGYMKMSVSRLKNLMGFPGSLADKIRFVGRGTYRLDLIPSEIYLIELFADG